MSHVHLTVIQETWKPIPSHAGYEASDLGRIRSRLEKASGSGVGRGKYVLGDQWRIKVPSLTHEGYLVTPVGGGPRCRQRKVHHLVLEAFVGPCPEGQQCRHLNGIRNDNRLSNLVWGTARENQADCRRHGTLRVGSRHHRTKLTEAQVIEIRRLWKSGTVKQVEIQARFGIGETGLWSILKNRTWRHV